MDNASTGCAGLCSGQLTITSSAQPLSAATLNGAFKTGYGSNGYYLRTTANCYIGGAGVTTTTGMLISATDTSPTEIETSALLYVIGTSGTLSFIQLSS